MEASYFKQQQDSNTRSEVKFPQSHLIKERIEQEDEVVGAILNTKPIFLVTSSGRKSPGLTGQDNFSSSCFYYIFALSFQSYFK